MSAILDDSDRFWLLADAVCTGTASDEELHELEARVIADKNARRLYLAYCQLDAVLELELGGSRAGESVHETIQSELPDPTPAGLVIAAPKVSPREPMGPISIVVGPTSRRTDDDLSAGWPMAYLASAVICGLGILVCAFIPVYHSVQVAQQSDRSQTATESVGQNGAAPRPARSSSEFPPMVGQVTGMVDCKWSDPQTEADNGASVPLGRKYALSSGLMQITYHSGAKVILQGPCTYEVESETGGYLSVGKLTARLDGAKPQAASPSLSTTHYPLSTTSPLFTITTPTATVTDLGTEFGVEVSEEGDTTSHVFRGSVEVRHTALAGQTEAAARVLHENESARVERGDEAAGTRLVVLDVSAKPAHFVRKLVRPTIKTFDLVDVVAGGDGFSGKRNGGIDPTTGEATDTSPVPKDNLFWLTGDGQYHLVNGLPFVDGVFIPSGRVGPVQVDSAGHTFDGFFDSDGTTSGYVWAGGAIPAPAPIVVQTELDGVDYATAGHGLLFLHANKGITFDLETIRRTNPGCNIVRFLATAGNTEVGSEKGLPVFADLWVLVDGQSRFRRREITRYNGAMPINISLDNNDRFLTLAATDGGNGIAGDWIIFGDPRLELVSTAGLTP